MNYLMKTQYNQDRRLYSIVFLPFYSLMKLYIKIDFKHSYEKIIHGSSLSGKQIAEIYNFRIRCYENKSEHLIPTTEYEVNKELDFDKRAYHAIVRDKNGEIVAVSRYIPYHFEMCDLPIPKKVRLKTYSNYLEISRLVTSKPGIGIGKRILVHAGIWAILDSYYDGFLAIARHKNTEFFSHFGLAQLASFDIKTRPGSKYSLIKADFRLISKCTFKFFAVTKNPAYQLAIALKIFSFSKLITKA